MNQENVISFTTAAFKFFGPKPGQKLAEFSKEIGNLSYEDKVELAAMISLETGRSVLVNKQ